MTQDLNQAVQAALDAYERFREADDIEALDNAMSALRASLAFSALRSGKTIQVEDAVL